MIVRMRNKAGFTLAELMMSIAIVLILAAVALPSIFTAQTNMRMVELNNAAQSIANAAQAQMTSMKVSGTWMAFLDARADEAKDASYLLRDEAQSAEIITSLSIDSTVYEGDYVIVFDRDTASVTEVYYADGKSGFFGEAPASTTAAQAYYNKGACDPEQTARMKNDPMIGYYSGTPAGATSEVALENPVIWVDEATGRLMVQDPNIAEDATSGSTNTTVSVSNATTGGSFDIAGLSNGTPALSVTSESAADSLVLKKDQTKELLIQVKRDAPIATSSAGNVYAIDLNALADVVDKKGEAGTEGEVTLKTILAACSPDNDLSVKVTTKSAEEPSVPAIANANIKWPAPVGRLTILVTNPYSVEVQNDGADQKIDTPPVAYKNGPTVVALNSNQEAPNNKLKTTPISEDIENKLRDTKANEKLMKENKQAGYQSYTGGWVPSSKAVNDASLRLKATVGSYNSHAYQIWELWIKRSDNGDVVRIGYLNDNKWEWAAFVQDEVEYDYSFLDSCFTWYASDGTSYESLSGRDTDALSIVAASLKTEAFYKAAKENPTHVLSDDDGNATMYIRTAPKTSEVQNYFNDQVSANTLRSSYLSKLVDDDGATETSSRTSNSSTGSSVSRAAFENEFGASSSDVSWAVSCSPDAGFSQGDDYLADGVNVRVYYSIAPGLGFKNIRDYVKNDATAYLKNIRSACMTNVSLWLYRGTSFGDLTVNPAALLYNDGGAFEYVCQQSGDDYDFKLATSEDYRFYRVLKYKVQNGSMPDQYVPHVSANDEKIATIATAENYEDDENIYKFDNWTTRDVTEGDSLVLEGGKKVSDYRELSNEGTTLIANYKKEQKVKPSIGMMYIEKGVNSEGSVGYGYYGYLNDSEPLLPDGLLSNSYTLTDGGYYVVVPEGSSAPSITDDGGMTVRQFDETIALTIQNGKYDCYRLYASTKDVGTTRTLDKVKKQNYTLSVKSNVSTGSGTKVVEGTFTINLAFACAVEKDENSAASWGSSASPWKVRLGRQFVGCLGSNGEDSVQSKYVTNNHFIQTHDIDLGDAPVNGVSKFRWEFLGSSYDGDKNAIYGLQYRLQNGTSPGEDTGVNGLFPKVSQSTIENVRIVLDIDDSQEYVTLSTHQKMSFGLLIGSAKQVVVANCEIQPIDDQPAKIIVSKTSDSDVSDFYVGCLVGYAEQLNLSNCSVSGLTLYLSNKGRIWTSGPYIGIIAGKIVNSASIANCNVSNTTVSLTSYLKDGMILYFGGIFGSADTITVSNCTFNTVYLRLPGAQSRDGVHAGIVAGRVINPSIIANNLAENMAVYIDPSAGIPITKDTGDQ